MPGSRSRVDESSASGGERSPAGEESSPDRGEPSPGAHATRAPEAPIDDDGAVLAVGVGPGDPAYLTGRATAALADADDVVGFGSVLDVVRGRTDARFHECSYDDQEATLAGFAGRVANGARGVAALWGDPSVSGAQFLGRVERAVDRPVSVVPGVSSVGVAAARARTPLDASTVVSLHRRGDVSAHLDRLVRDAGDRHLLVLPGPGDWPPEAVAAHLVAGGADPDARTLVLERLTLPDERRTDTTLAALASDPADADSRFDHLSVLVVRR